MTGRRRNKLPDRPDVRQISREERLAALDDAIVAAVQSGADRANLIFRVGGVLYYLHAEWGISPDAYEGLFDRLASLAKAGRIHFDRRAWRWREGAPPEPPSARRITATTLKFEHLDNAILRAIIDGRRTPGEIFEAVLNHIPPGVDGIIPKRLASLKRRGFVYHNPMKRAWAIAEDIRHLPVVTTPIPAPR